MSESRLPMDVRNAKLVDSARSGKPHLTRRHHRRSAVDVSSWPPVRLVRRTACRGIVTSLQMGALIRSCGGWTRWTTSPVGDRVKTYFSGHFAETDISPQVRVGRHQSAGTRRNGVHSASCIYAAFRASQRGSAQDAASWRCIRPGSDKTKGRGHANRWIG